jgi:hypothetical protein
MISFLLLVVLKANLLVSTFNMTAYLTSLTQSEWERPKLFEHIRDQSDYTSILIVSMMDQCGTFDRSSSYAKAEIIRFMSTETAVHFIDRYRHNKLWEWETLVDCISSSRPKDKAFDTYISCCMTDANARTIAHLYWVAEKRHYYGLIPFAIRDFFSQRYVSVLNGAPGQDYRLQRFARDYLIDIWADK